jgi:hypothetical protein
VPDAARWAQTFTHEMGANPRGVQKYGAPGAVRHAVVGIAEACIHDPDTMLRDLLAATIADSQAWVAPSPVPVTPAPAEPRLPTTVT